jgi:hypothetical protein
VDVGTALVRAIEGGATAADRIARAGDLIRELRAGLGEV